MSAWRKLAGPGIVTAVAVAILVSLGTWQANRLAWKERLVAQVTARLDDAPVPAPGPSEWPGLDVSAAEYTPVSVTGTFDETREAYVIFALTRPRGPHGGPGYMVMTPLETTEGWTVYVNRGFVPADRKLPAQRPGSSVSGQVSVAGLLRVPSQRPWYVLSDDAAGNAWFSRDPMLYAAAYGAPSAQIAPYIIDAAFDPSLPDGLPQGGETPITFSNNHLGYAITWYGLALAAIGVFIAFARRRLSSSP